MKLYLVQHGDASPKEDDPQRSLSLQGRGDIWRLAEFLGQAGIGVEKVIHSGKLRAAETAEMLAGKVAPFTKPEVNDHINPKDDPRAFDWEKVTEGKDTMLVGHMPCMARLASLLIAGNPDKVVAACVPGSVICLECGSDGRWQINWMIRPELLKFE